MAEPYYHISQGIGGIFKLPMTWYDNNGDPIEVKAIGTTGCRTCVCIYIPLEDNKCFVAHLSGYIMRSEVKDTTNSHVSATDRAASVARSDISDSHWIIDEHEVEKEDEVTKIWRAKLREFRPVLKENTTQEQKDSAIIVCPHRKWNGKPTTGARIIDLIYEEYGLSSNVSFEFAHGFIYKMEEEVPAKEMNEDGDETPKTTEMRGIRAPAHSEEYFDLNAPCSMEDVEYFEYDDAIAEETSKGSPQKEDSSGIKFLKWRDKENGTDEVMSPTEEQWAAADRGDKRIVDIMYAEKPDVRGFEACNRKEWNLRYWREPYNEWLLEQ